MIVTQVASEIYEPSTAVSRKRNALVEVAPTTSIVNIGLGRGRSPGGSLMCSLELGRCTHASAFLRRPLPLPLPFLLFLFLSGVAFTSPVDAFHSLGYFHTFFVSRYSSILHRPRQAQLYLASRFPAGQHPWLPATGTLRPISRHLFSRAKEKQPGQLPPRPPICTTTTTAAHSLYSLPRATCNLPSPDLSE